MPIQSCSEDGKSGYRYGKSGKCYTHDGSPEGAKEAKKKAIKQGLAEQYNGGEKFVGSFEELLQFGLEEQNEQN
jgi:hypothetical protein